MFVGPTYGGKLKANTGSVGVTPGWPAGFEAPGFPPGLPPGGENAVGAA
jgi:hypothetical protein